jgi:hypothetical protein
VQVEFTQHAKVFFAKQARLNVAYAATSNQVIKEAAMRIAASYYLFTFSFL